MLLADGGVASEGAGVLDDRALRGQPQPLVHLERGAPLCEPRPLCVVRLAPLPEAVQPLRRSLVGGASQPLQPRVHLHADVDALISQQLYEPHAAVCALVHGLVEQDAAGDVVAQAGRRVEKLSEVLSVLLRVSETDRKQPLTCCHRALVRREDAMPWPRDLRGRLNHLRQVWVVRLKLGSHHRHGSAWDASPVRELRMR
mmetsp:Transcript_31441/g.53777  ORF Transcript_31441/g.53777 Transcript_31441/m.53777 type:complete len:200 (+) Transcript_31441:807-1406(+)